MVPKDGTVRYNKNFKLATFASTREPENVIEALNDKSWKNAMNIEYDALVKIRRGILLHLSQGGIFLIVSGYIKSKRKLVVQYTDTKLG